MRRVAACGLTGIAAVLAVVAVLPAGCGDEPLDYENACPSIVHAGDAVWMDGSLHFGVWIRDIEEDPVDLVVTRADGSNVENVFGHGAVGLTSLADEKGAPHELIITKDELNGTKVLTIEPVDAPGCSGQVVKLDVPAAE